MGQPCPGISRQNRGVGAATYFPTQTPIGFAWEGIYSPNWLQQPRGLHSTGGAQQAYANWSQRCSTGKTQAPWQAAAKPPGLGCYRAGSPAPCPEQLDVKRRPWSSELLRQKVSQRACDINHSSQCPDKGTVMASGRQGAAHRALLTVLLGKPEGARLWSHCVHNARPFCPPAL